MMSSKRVSQLAMLSILLTFTHTVSHASLTVPAKVSSIVPESAQPICKLYSKAKSVDTKKEKNSSERKSSRFGFSKQKSTLIQESNTEDKQCKESVKTERPRIKNIKKTRERVNRLSPKKSLDFRNFQMTSRSRVKETQATKDASFLKSIFVKQKKKSLPKDQPQVDTCNCLDTVASVDISKISQEERERLLQELAREQRISKRKSSRSALKERLKENQIPRGGSVTSTLRYDMEKAAAVKVKRNASVNSHIRTQKTANSRRSSAEARSEKLKVSQVAAGEPSEKSDSKEQTEKQPTADNYFQEVSSARNTNVNSYLEAKQYQCDSEETDWPCASCVSKRRANTSMSVCTLVVTVIAIIVGAIIICNASADSTTQSGSTSTS
ncbi:hypothetical protein BOKEGFJH_00155 [Chlamydia avium]|nr:hypothetical protein BOKEGFJH_00155 [Chlamydia avium]